MTKCALLTIEIEAVTRNYLWRNIAPITLTTKWRNLLELIIATLGKFCNIEKETPLLTPQRDHTKVLGSNTGRCDGTLQTDYSITKGKEHKNPIKGRWLEPSQGRQKREGQKRGQKTYSPQEPKKKNSLTSMLYLLKYQGPKMVHCRIQLLCSCCNPLVASLSSQLSSAATRNTCWSPEISQFKLDEKSGFSSQFQSSGFRRPGFNYH